MHDIFPGLGLNSGYEKMKRKMKNGPVLIGPEKYLIMDYLLVLFNLEAPGSKYRFHVEQPMKRLTPNLILDLNLHLLNL